MYLGQDTATDGAHEPPDACKKYMRVHICAQRHKTILWSKWSFGILKGSPQSADGFVLFTPYTTSTPQIGNWACLPCCHPSPDFQHRDHSWTPLLGDAQKHTKMAKGWSPPEAHFSWFHHRKASCFMWPPLRCNQNIAAVFRIHSYQPPEPATDESKEGS